LLFALNNQAIGPSLGMTEGKINAPLFALDTAAYRALAGKDWLLFPAACLMRWSMCYADILGQLDAGNALGMGQVFS